MTEEGIIQKAFEIKDYWKAQKSFCAEVITKELEDIEQYIIAEIEKMEITEGNYHDNSIYVDKIKLIGKTGYQ